MNPILNSSRSSDRAWRGGALAAPEESRKERKAREKKEAAEKKLASEEAEAQAGSHVPQVDSFGVGPAPDAEQQRIQPSQTTCMFFLSAPIDESRATCLYLYVVRT